MLVHKAMLVLHWEGSGGIFARTQRDSFPATCPRINSPQLPAKAVPCQQLTKATQCLRGAENPSGSMQSCWHVLCVSPEPLCGAQLPAPLCQGKGSAQSEAGWRGNPRSIRTVVCVPAATCLRFTRVRLSCPLNSCPCISLVLHWGPWEADYSCLPPPRRCGCSLLPSSLKDSTRGQPRVWAGLEQGDEKPQSKSAA